MAASFQSRSEHARCWTRTDRITQLIVYSGCLSFYVGVGAVAHAAFLGPDVAWHSSQSWIVILGWPLVAFCWTALFGSLVGALVFCGYVLAPASLVHALAATSANVVKRRAGAS